MNTGVISTRYASALLAFSNREGDADAVCRQAGLLLKRFEEVPRLREVLSLRAEQREAAVSLLKTALGDEAMTPSLERFLILVQEKGRMLFLRLMLHDFIQAYYRERNIRIGKLTSAVPLPAEMVEKYRRAAEQRFGGSVRIEEEINPSIIGGVVFTVDGWRLDASVASQLKRLRSELIEKNKRIV